MANFKVDHDAQIKGAKSLLEAQIKGELEKMKAEKAGRKGGDTLDDRDRSGTSPSNSSCSITI